MKGSKLFRKELEFTSTVLYVTSGLIPGQIGKPTAHQEKDQRAWLLGAFSQFACTRLHKLASACKAEEGALQSPRTPA